VLDCTKKKGIIQCLEHGLPFGKVKKKDKGEGLHEVIISGEDGRVCTGVGRMMDRLS